jgi:hypothetical protein
MPYDRTFARPGLAVGRPSTEGSHVGNILNAQEDVVMRVLPTPRMSEATETARIFLALFGDRADARDRAASLVERLERHPVWRPAELNELRQILDNHFANGASVTCS